MIKIAFLGKKHLISNFLPESFDERFSCTFIPWENLEDRFSEIKEKYPVVVLLLAGDFPLTEKDLLSKVKKIAMISHKRIIVINEEKYIELTLKILQMGAFDFVKLPPKKDLFSKKEFQIKFLSLLDIVESRYGDFYKDREVGDSNEKYFWQKIENIELPPLILLGISTGGPKILEDMFKSVKIQKFYYPVVIVLHMPDNYVDKFITLLKSNFPFSFEKVTKGTILEENKVYILAGNKNMELSSRGYFIESHNQDNSYYKPSINEVFISAARHYGSRCVGILMSGIGDDGVLGLDTIKKKGGLTVVQDENTSIVYGMPSAAIEKKVVDAVLSIEMIGNLLEKFNLLVEKKKMV